MRVVALTFHDVAAEESRATPERGDAWYQVTVNELESLLSQLRKLGYRTASSKQFRLWQQGTASLSERTVVLTFDDGYASHFTLVASLLLRYRFSGTFFVTTDHIGRPGYLSWEQLRKLVFLGMEIGSHGMSHRPLTTLSREDLEKELSQSKRTLEEQLGVPIRALAAPGGFWNGTVTDAAQRAGFDAVWISTIGTNGKETNTLGLRRIVVRRPVSVDRVISIVQGSRRALWWATNQQLLIRGLKRVLGVYWYERLKRRLVPDA